MLQGMLIFHEIGIAVVMENKPKLHQGLRSMQWSKLTQGPPYVEPSEKVALRKGHLKMSQRPQGTRRALACIGTGRSPVHWKNDS